MPRIHVLSDRVANQIAAGEVIERPAAVVKELVENALDAKATRIEVEFSHGGRSFMRVEDNGVGMSREDALLALQRHATSKIAEADDLNRLTTFGFRGEALPSIASVSRFLIQTREVGQDLGTEILVNGGKLAHVRECGRAVGTRIEVAQLFNSVPARRKFLKTDTTEAAHIIHAVRLYALSFPEVGFTLIEEGRVIFRSPHSTTLLERIGGIFGKQLADGLMPLEAAEHGMRISGLIGQPGQGRATRHEMITFINQRPVDSRTLNYALIESFHESLPKGRYPIAFVFFEISPADVDVNVHPAKREVRFRSEPAVRSFVIRTILSRLREYGETRRPAFEPSAYVASLPLTGDGIRGGPPSIAIPRSGDQPVQRVDPSAPSPRVTPEAAPWPGRVVTLRGDSSSNVSPGISRPVPAASPAPERAEREGAPQPASAPTSVHPSLLKTWRYLGLAHRQYALFETAGGVGLLDRRAAQERVWYERLQSAYASGSVASQRLLLPVPLELDTIASALLIDAKTFLEKHGFEIGEFGRNFFRVEAVPDWLEPVDAEKTVRDVISLLREGQLHAKEMNLARDELVRFSASRAVRLAETVSEAEVHALVSELFRCRTPLTSPAGRPTFLELSHAELARRFGK